MAESPSTDNYRLGKGILYFKGAGDTEFRDLGNVPDCEVTLDLESLDHFTARSGVRSKDKSVVVQKGGQVRIVLEEWSPENLAMAMLGDLTTATTINTIDVFSRNSFEGELKFVGTNEVGPKWHFHYYNVSFQPGGTLPWIQDEWGQMEITGELLVASSGPNAGKFGILTDDPAFEANPTP